MTVEKGHYRDIFEPSGPVEVIGTGYHQATNSRLVVIRVSGSELFELVRPAEFFQPVTVRTAEGQTDTMARFTPCRPGAD